MSDQDTPYQEAGASAPGRKPPPKAYQFRKGQSGNPKGRPPNAGQSIKEAWNKLAEALYSEQELRALVADPSIEAVVRIAARELVYAVEHGDLADFEDYLNGNVTLAELRSRGINTSIIKKVKRKATQVLGQGGEDDGKNVELEFTAEIELHDRAGNCIDRIMDRTDGRPIQSVRVAEASTGEHNPTVVAGLMGLPGFDSLVEQMEEKARLAELAEHAAVDPSQPEPTPAADETSEDGEQSDE